MNKRLREFERESKLEIYGLGARRDKWEKALEKYAELIVEECRYVMDCNKGSDQNTAWNQALSETSEKIKQHFGVEE